MIRVGVRAKVQSAVRAMKRAELTEDPLERLELARSSTLELVAAYELTRVDDPARRASLEQALARIASLPDGTPHAAALARLREGHVTTETKLEYERQNKTKPAYSINAAVP